MADDFKEIFCTDKRASDYLIFGKHESGEYSIYITDAEFTEKKAFAFTPQDGEIVKTAALMKYGKSAVLTTLNDNSIRFNVNISFFNVNNNRMLSFVEWSITLIFLFPSIIHN